MKSGTFAPLLVLLLSFQGIALGGKQFRQGQSYQVGTEPETVVAADFNNDGKVDVATADFTSQDVTVLLGNGDGTFQAAKQFSTSKGPSALAVGDTKVRIWRSRSTTPTLSAYC